MRWKRFWSVLAPSLAALAVLAVGMAQGAVPASFAVSGRRMKVSAAKLSGRGVGMVPGVVRSVDGRRHVVVRLSLRTAQVYGLCQSAEVDTPMGPFTVRLGTRDREKPSRISELDISATSLSADVDLGSVVLNRDAGTPGAGNVQKGRRGDYGVDVLTFSARDVTADAWMVMGGSFLVDGLSVTIGQDVRPCF
ncbi:DUF6230 family protein [Nonomuraea sp. NPDC050783]|uniref:DUF6230 family protein n=1 Tax=Nonomuraea sp. NPDC050783 TaxID=3154634 RepID=UPI00346535DF